MKQTDRKKETNEAGFTLLLAALISSVVLSLGAAVFAIAQKEISLSSAGRNSQFAFYVADTASECALYWDERYAYFATTSPAITPICDGQTLNVAVTSGDRTSGNYTMTFSYAPNGYCANATITKSQNPITGAVHTVISTNGYSTPVGNPASCTPPVGGSFPTAVTDDPQALQRSVELSY